MDDFGNVLLALLAIFAPLALAGWLLSRKPRSGRADAARRAPGPGRDNMDP